MKENYRLLFCTILIYLRRGLAINKEISQYKIIK